MLETAPPIKRAAAPEPYQALVLETLTPAQAEALNALYRRRAPGSLELGDTKLILEARWSQPRHDGRRMASLAFTLDDADGLLHLPLTVVEGALSACLAKGTLEELEPQTAALLLEAQCAAAIEAVERRLGVSIQLSSCVLRDPPGERPSYPFTALHQGERFDCALEGDRAAALLAALLDQEGRGKPPTPAGLPLAASLWRYAVTLSLADLRSLYPGDVIVVDDAQAMDLLVISDRLCAPVGAAPGGLRLLAGLTELIGSKWEWIMVEDTLASAGLPLEEAKLDALPITLVFEVGRTAMPLGDVAQLEAGSIVSLNGITRPNVDIIANGKRLGHGEIVRVGDSIGVRVLRMVDND